MNKEHNDLHDEPPRWMRDIVEQARRRFTTRFPMTPRRRSEVRDLTARIRDSIAADKRAEEITLSGERFLQRCEQEWRTLDDRDLALHAYAAAEMKIAVETEQHIRERGIEADRVALMADNVAAKALQIAARSDDDLSLMLRMAIRLEAVVKEELRLRDIIFDDEEVHLHTVH